jgi:DNA polymerase IV
MTADELHTAEDQLIEHGATLTYDVTEAKLVLTTATSKKRLEFDLRTRRLWTKEVPQPPVTPKRISDIDLAERPKKRARRQSLTTIHSSGGHAADISRDASSTESETESEEGQSTPRKSTAIASRPPKVENSPILIPDSDEESEDDAGERGLSKHEVNKEEIIPSTPPRIDSGFDNIPDHSTETIRVAKLAWLRESLEAKKVLPIEPYVVYEGIPVSRPSDITNPLDVTPPRLKPSKVTTPPPPIQAPKKSESPSSIIERAIADVGASTSIRGLSHFAPAPHGPRRFHNQHHSRDQHLERQSHKEAHAELLQQTSSSQGTDSDIPPPPEWVRKGWRYSCQRSTQANPPNEAFIKELEKIKMARLLTGDEIGVRAYSTSIASVAAYPYKFVSPKEILRLPGCDVKIANLWIEWKNEGRIKAAEEAEKDESLVILKRFWNIWGVGDKGAREFYYDKGWKDLDDVIEYGWNDLTRTQQIGVKFYDEFLTKIPRSAVEFIAAKVKEHAIRVRDEGIEMIVVGGHRRGKKESNDVDVLVSHRDLDKTKHLARDITTSLEDEGWVTHTLSLTEKTTERGQSTLPFKSRGVASHGAGFDSLDKALVVWQDLNWPTMEADLRRDPDARNPNIHRRVDIIISPWRTVGCAVCGWSSGTTFQRDLRRHAKNVKGWKFDSSGIRDRRTGEIVTLEGPEGVSGSMIDAEKRVFEGLGLIYREPWERCTG